MAQGPHTGDPPSTAGMTGTLSIKAPGVIDPAANGTVARVRFGADSTM
jgi:hypothetical protein